MEGSDHCQTEAAMQVGARRSQISGDLEYEWFKHRPNIFNLYVCQKISLASLRDELEQLGLRVTMSQLEYKLKQWKFVRNLSEKQWRQVFREVKKRENAGKNESDIIYGGAPVEPRGVKRKMKALESTAAKKARRATTPSSTSDDDSLITVCTPPPVSMKFEWPTTLPWIMFHSSLSFNISHWICSNRNQADSVNYTLQLQLQGMIRSALPQEEATGGGPGTNSNISRFASMIGIVMPESYTDQHWYRARAVVGMSATHSLDQVVTLAIYYLSNNLCRLEDVKIWKSIASMIEESGLVTQQRNFDFTLIQDLTVQAFTEKLFQAAVFHAVIKRCDGAKRILEWLLESNCNANSPVWIAAPGISVTAVQLSVIWGRIDILGSLMRHQGDADLTLSELDTPLGLALKPNEAQLLGFHLPPTLSSKDAINMARTLLDGGATIDLAIQSGQASFISLVIGLGDPNFVREVLSKHPSIDIQLRTKCTDGILGETTVMTSAAGFPGYNLDDEARNEAALILVKYLKETFKSLPQAAPFEHWITADEFIAAAAVGNSRVVEFLSRVSQSFSSSNAFGITPLHAAAESGCIATCKLLLSLRHPVNLPSEYPSPLHIACAHGNYEIADLLLEHGAEVDMCVEFDKEIFNRQLRCDRHFSWESEFGHRIRSRPITPLRLALATNCPDSEGADYAITLLNCGAKLSGGEFGIIALDRTIQLAFELLKAGADPNEKTPGGWHVLAWAIFSECKPDRERLADLAETFLHHGAELSTKDIARIFCNWELDSKLVDCLLSLVGKQQGCITVLETAFLSCNKRSIKKVLGSHDIQYDPSSLCAAIATGQRQATIRELLVKREKQGRDEAHVLETTAIGLEILVRDVDERVLCLLNHDDLPHSSMCVLPLAPRYRYHLGFHLLEYDMSRYGELFWHDTGAIKGSILSYAVLAGDGDELMRLLNRGHEPDWVTWWMLAKKNATEMASTLRQKGFAIPISREFPNIAHTPFNLAISHRNTDMVRILLDAGLPANVDYDCRVEGDRTPLQFAVEEAALDIIVILLDAGVCANEKPARRSGATALQLAAIKGYLGIAKLLLEHGADVNAPRAEEHGRTALEGAAEHGRIDMIELLLRSGARTTGTGRWQYVRSVKLAERMGNLAAARLLRSWQHWTDENEEMSLELDILGRDGWWFDGHGDGDDDDDDNDDDDDDDDDDSSGDDDNDDNDDGDGDDEEADSDKRRVIQDQVTQDYDPLDEFISWGDAAMDGTKLGNSVKDLGFLYGEVPENQDFTDWVEGADFGATLRSDVVGEENGEGPSDANPRGDSMYDDAMWDETIWDNTTWDDRMWDDI